MAAPRPSLGALRPRPSAMGIILIALGYCLWMSFEHPAPAGLERVLGWAWVTVLVGGSAAACFVRARRPGEPSAAFGLLGAALLCSLAAPAFPGRISSASAAAWSADLGDVLDLAFYSLALGAVYVLLAGRRNLGRAAVDAVIAGLTIGAGLAVVALPRSAGEPPGPAALLDQLSSPVLGLLLFLGGLMLLDVTRFRPPPKHGLVATGLMLIASVELVLGAHVQPMSIEGAALDIAWPVGAAMLGAGALTTGHGPPAMPHGTWERAVVPATFGILAVALLAVGSYWPLPPLALVLALGSVALMTVRLALLYRENAKLADRLLVASRRAETDPLTGLLNHRAFHDRLASASQTARYAQSPLSLVVMDLDGFKGINDLHGHSAGDAVILEVSRRVASVARADDSVGRIGGDEIGWLVPGLVASQAAYLAEAARRMIAAHGGAGVATVTASCGIADLQSATDARSLFTLADRALYSAKRAGGDRVWVDSDRALLEEGTPWQGIAAVHALAKAVDARDGPTHDHGARVGDVAVEIARALGWRADQSELLRACGLLHDVGKVGVPDAVLLKRGALDRSEQELMRGHAEIGAGIVTGLLADEQVAWVRHHHERWDGRGYPDGLVGDAIPAGAQILAVADAFEAMTEDRPYRRGLSEMEALDILVAGRGTHWSPAAVDALLRVRRRPAKPVQKRIAPERSPRSSALSQVPAIAGSSHTSSTSAAWVGGMATTGRS